MEFISIKYILFEILGYQISLIELIGSIAGLISVVYAIRNHIITWHASIISAVAFLIIFYQVNLYSDALLQIFYVVISIYGIIKWSDKSKQNRILKLSGPIRLILLSFLLLGTYYLGWFISEIHILLPKIFIQPAAFPYADAFTTLASMLAVWLLSKRILENWVLWIAVDIVSIYLYLSKGVLFIGIEFVIFLILATSGLFSWINQMKKEK